MWGLNELVSVETCIAIAEIVAHEQNKIGPSMRGRRIGPLGICGHECSRNHDATGEESTNFHVDEGIFHW